MSPARVHFLTLDPGEEFLYKPGGPAFRRAPDDQQGQARVERAEAGRWVPAGVQDYQGCYVLPTAAGRGPRGDD